MKSLEGILATSKEVKRAQVLFDETTGLIHSVGALGISRSDLDFYFDDKCLVFAGMGDIHIHAREDVSGKNTYKEDFHSAHEAMVNGGVTHAGDMPNNPVPPIDDESYAQKVRLAEKVSGDIWMYAGIGPNTKPLSSTVPYKVYMGPSIGDLFFKDFETLDQTLSHYKNQWVSFHCEDPEILEAHTHEDHHHERRPRSAEAVATRDALHLIEKYKLKGKLCHYSTKEGLNLVREARKRGAEIYLEVTPQHLYFDLEHLKVSDYLPYQMNPPIRFEEDRLELLEAIKKGEIQFLATDHAPHSQEEKDAGHSGLTGLDTYGPFVTWLLENGTTPEIIATITAENPGDFFNNFLPSWKKISKNYEKMGLGLGYLKPGYRANFTILNKTKSLKVSREFLKTKVKHSPFLNHVFPGQVEALFIGGKKL